MGAQDGRRQRQERGEFLRAKDAATDRGRREEDLPWGRASRGSNKGSRGYCKVFVLDFFSFREYIMGS